MDLNLEEKSSEYEASNPQPENKKSKKWIVVFISIAGLILSLPFMAFLEVRYSFKDRIIYRLEEVESVEYGIVFGAGVIGDRPSAVLGDRVGSSVELYNSGKVKKLLMSGDGRMTDYDEPEVMKNVAIELGVPESDILMDKSGLRTYNTCFRARQEYGIAKAVLVTQDFHLERSLYTCNKLGIDSVGYVADEREYSGAVRFSLREIPASVMAYLEVNFLKPEV